MISERIAWFYFLNSLDNKTWKVVINGWKHPTNKVDMGIEFVKLKKDLEPVEDEVACGNFCVLNAIHNGVEKNILKIINT